MRQAYCFCCFPIEPQAIADFIIEVFNTTMASFPLALIKAVVCSLSLLDELITRCAPGRINFENWPM
jgi:hypothetical protein